MLKVIFVTPYRTAKENKSQERGSKDLPKSTYECQEGSERKTVHLGPQPRPVMSQPPAESAATGLRLPSAQEALMELSITVPSPKFRNQ